MQHRLRPRAKPQAMFSRESDLVIANHLAIIATG